MLNTEIKIANLEKLAAYRDGLFQKPELRHLFLELTMRCNENCLHCGSRCNDVTSEELTLKQYQDFLTQIKQDFGTQKKMLCITGGEPLLRKDFFEIMSFANDLGFVWGMTSNGTLITDSVAEKLADAGMKTISISLDGLPETHDAFRRTKGGWEKAMNGIQCLIQNRSFQHVQITTVVTHKSIKELDALYQIFNDLAIDSWRIINMEPIGRAKQYPELLLTKEDYQQLFEFIRNMRIAGEPVCYGCSHYLGLEYEREVRDWYFLCMAGIYTASITASGDMIACLDIERRPEFVQGNILHDRFKDVWENKYQIFRKNLCDENAVCGACPEKQFCHGGAYHSWDFEKQQPSVCFRNILF